MTTRPLVSVVIPCYNYGRYLPAAVEAALDQRGVDVEVIVVDDASTDDSASVAERLAAHPCVRLLRHDRNRGHIATYNDGLASAVGDYVTLVSADDLLASDALTRAVALMEAHPTVGLVYGFVRSFEDVPEPSVGRVRSWSIYSGQEWLRLAARRGRCFIVSPEAVMRREALELVGPYDRRLPHSADFAMWLRTAAAFDVGRVNGPIQAHYRVHGANMHLTDYAGWITDLEERRRTFEIVFRGPDRPDDADHLLADAHRAIAREAARRGVAATRDGDSAASLYLDFADQLDPHSVSDRAVAFAGSFQQVAAVEPLRAAWRFADRLGDHLLWQRRRRFGT